MEYSTEIRPLRIDIQVDPDDLAGRLRRTLRSGL
jgi:hypothetical protein